ncbi:hypothetical protein VBY75_08480 [Idiomarina sp. HB]|uniref:hypothetical protein n=1 Tax=Idiomarina sp. HB TaxID=3110479 RepID=UPI003A804598
MIGYKSFNFNGLKWRFNQGAIVPLSMPHSLEGFSETEAKKLLRRKNSLLVRWESAFDCESGKEWWHIIKDVPEDLSKLPKKTRYNIRKAEKSFECKRVSLTQVLEHGYSTYLNASSRYETHEKTISQKNFQHAINTLPSETEFWAAYSKESGRMAAFAENYVSEDACFYLSLWIEPKALKELVGYMLFHEMNKHYLNDRGMSYVSDGARSISHDTNIHDFLISKFKFRKAYANLNVVYSPLVKIVTSSLYPFKRLIKKMPLNFAKKLHVLLEQERIRRACKK